MITLRKAEDLPILVGLNQPQPGVAPLWPNPPGCAGWRLWKMCYDVCGIQQEMWIKLVRENLIHQPHLPQNWRIVARGNGVALASQYQGRSLVLLGEDVANAMGHGKQPFVWDTERCWVTIPHPSGRNLFYNNPIHRVAAGILLTDLIWDSYNMIARVR